MQYKFLLIWAILFLASTGIIAQNETEDIIYLEGGEVIRGEVLEFDPKTNIKIKILGGSILVYESTKVLKMEKGERKNTDLKHTSNDFKVKERGIYHSIMGGSVHSLSGFGGAFAGLPSIGFSVDYSIGYQFHRLFGLGANIGFFMPSFEVFIPINLNVRGYFMKKKASLYYDVNTGFGLTLNGVGWDGRKGGLHFRPAIGVVFPSSKKGRFTMDLGYTLQVGGIHEFEHHAISLRAGVTF